VLVMRNSALYPVAQELLTIKSTATLLGGRGVVAATGVAVAAPAANTGTGSADSASTRARNRARVFFSGWVYMGASS